MKEFLDGENSLKNNMANPNLYRRSFSDLRFQKENVNENKEEESLEKTDENKSEE